ncbi:MAG: hypothetical protein KJ023_01930 [Burkholderiaceae bacterium]|nr:hypothetical protein [Burkholderiaceae bacterium]
MKKALSRLFATACLAAAGLAPAHAIDLLPRVGVQLGNAYMLAGAESNGLTGGLSLGMTAAGEALFFDVNLEALAMDIPSAGVLVSGYRSELGATVGVRVHDGIALIAGYRQAQYGEGLGSGKLAKNSGPFFGVNFPELRLGSSNRDILSLSLAVQRNTYESTTNNIPNDTDVGFSIRVGYRKAGSPHSFGLRYQGFGSAQFDESLTTLQYSYVFGSF